MEQLRRLRSRKFRPQRAQWIVVLSSVIRRKPHCLWITAETKSSKLITGEILCHGAKVLL
jgi:hypothetical protein